MPKCMSQMSQVSQLSLLQLGKVVTGAKTETCFPIRSKQQSCGIMRDDKKGTSSVSERRETMRDGMRIGELAARFGLNPKTIRYYEEIGLLKRAGRSESGYRLYGKPDVERLGFIRRAKTLSLSLDEIRDILSAQEEGSPPSVHGCARVDTR